MTCRKSSFGAGTILGALVLSAVVVAGASAGYVDTVLSTSDLENYWRFEEDSGTTAVDLVNGNDGTYTHVFGDPHKLGEPGLSPALGFAGMIPDNKSVEFVYSSGRSVMSAANGAVIGDPVAGPTFADGISELTMSMWLRPIYGGEGYVAGFGQSSGARYVFSILKTGTNDLRIYVKADNGGQIATSVRVWDSAADYDWHHLALVWDGAAKRASFYLDGQQVIDEIDGSLSANLAVPYEFVVGRDHTGNTRNLGGGVDELALFGRALSGVEIQGHYDSRLVPDAAPAGGYATTVAGTPNLRHLFRFGEVGPFTGGTTAADSLGGKTATYVHGNVAGPAPTVGAAGPLPTDNAMIGFSTTNPAAGLNNGGKNHMLLSDPDTLGTKSFAAGEVTELSLAYWFHADPSQGQQWLAGYTNNSQPTRYNFIARRQNDGIRFYVKDADGDQFPGGGFTIPEFQVTDDDWHHLVMVWDGVGNEFRAYLDGGDSEIIRSGNNVDGALFAPQEFSIGADVAGAGNSFLDGAIDELAIFDRALSAAEVDQLYDAAFVPEPSSMALLALGLAAMTACRFRRRK